MKADEIIDALPQLTIPELRRVLAQAQALDEHYKAAQDPIYSPLGKKTYQQEYVRCGKPTCKKCTNGGPGHGPYWYAYWSENGRTRKEYIGKNRK